MISLVKILSTDFDSAKRRIYKVLGFGKSDVKTANECSPFGLDSCVPTNYIAVYSDTTDKGESVILGYYLPKQMVKQGETKLFSTDVNGVEKMKIYLTKDDIQINGNTDNLVRFSELEKGFEQLKQDLNNHIANYNSFAIAYVPGSIATVGLPPFASASTPSEANIDLAKIEELKTN